MTIAPAWRAALGETSNNHEAYTPYVCTNGHVFLMIRMVSSHGHALAQEWHRTAPSMRNVMQPYARVENRSLPAKLGPLVAMKGESTLADLSSNSLAPKINGAIIAN